MRRKVCIPQLLAISLLLFTTMACQAQARPEYVVTAAGVVPTAAETAVPGTPTAEPTIEELTALPSATAQPTVTPMPTATPSSRPTDTPVPTLTATPRPTSSPIPTSRPLAEGECIAWYEAPSFLDREVCVEGKVNFVRTANPARTLAFLVLDPSVPDIDHCCGIFYGWLYAEDWHDYVPTGDINRSLAGVCVRLHGTIEKSRERIRMPVRTPEQLEVIECTECHIPDACGL